ncbi:Molybdopterin synthase catalytic subunit [Taphrina deformans PYCC 5710]|uniref:Molybdopterin synthase catalytic subunit n=1 Tax=Taphrina deformans (strain PYCC 5710 / ATCC 11124 / CBS 356.35 / IMI 108563 / JCM 9778 / NBRC 8474) TaxID=1097556 RepID=R4XB07_TAPDE|nr:Molybdopterin synthase catalytic subunit [Taphrina deformans PYCC 5710]|eukprot:CCG82759.1 Molybdopterin synthase catalytic subunit [Taphrina deformans PYCC 5710]
MEMRSLFSLDLAEQLKGCSHGVCVHKVPDTRPGSAMTVNVHVGLQYEPLEVTKVIDLVRSPAAGAIVTFSGTTRNSFNGLEVLYLDYEAHDQMATRSLQVICQEASLRWNLQGAACFHRLGRVPIGEESILIAVSSAHRKAAWEAGEWILEEAKRKTEVWKKETFLEDQKQREKWKANEEFARKVSETI